VIEHWDLNEAEPILIWKSEVRLVFLIWCIFSFLHLGLFLSQCYFSRQPTFRYSKRITWRQQWPTSMHVGRVRWNDSFHRFQRCWDILGDAWVGWRCIALEVCMDVVECVPFYLHIQPSPLPDSTTNAPLLFQCINPYLSALPTYQHCYTYATSKTTMITSCKGLGALRRESLRVRSKLDRVYMVAYLYRCEFLN